VLSQPVSGLGDDWCELVGWHVRERSLKCTSGANGHQRDGITAASQRIPQEWQRRHECEAKRLAGTVLRSSGEDACGADVAGWLNANSAI